MAFPEISIAPRSVGRARGLPPDLLRRSTRRGLFPVAYTWFLIGALVILAGVGNRVWAWLAAMLGIGVLQYSLIILCHHAHHFDLSPAVRLNEFVGRWLLHGPLLHSLKASRLIHLRHHARLGRDDDADRFFYDLSLNGRESGKGMLRWSIAMFSGGVILPGLRKLTTLTWREDFVDDSRGENRQEKEAPPFELLDLTAVLVSQSLIASGMWWVTGRFWAWALLWALPMVTVSAGLSGLRSMLEHADRGKPPERFLSFVSSPLERFLVAPLNMNYHWEHHRFINVPFYHLPEVRRWLLQQNDYAPGRLLPSYWSRFGSLYRQGRSAAA